MNLDKPRRPHWMSREDYASFMKHHGASILAIMADGEEPTIDHIKPVSKNGGNELSNLQVVSRRENATKGNRNDAYWSSEFYFDKPINVSRLRYSQRDEVYYRLFVPDCNRNLVQSGRIYTYEKWFSRGISEISGLLYTLVHIVGSGKTLSMLVLGFAYNHMIIDLVGRGVRRANRMLVLAKDSAIRDQIADDFITDIVNYKICPSPPRTILVGSGGDAYSKKINKKLRGVDTADSLLNVPFLNSHVDVAVACVQQLWGTKRQVRPNLEEILHQFPLIVFDEPHFATDKVMDITRMATTSLCFGMTGSPINAAGDTVKRFVVFSVVDYQSAVEHDGGLKYLGLDNTATDTIITELKIEGAEVQRGQSERRIESHDAIGDDYKKAYEPSKSVARAVVDRLLTLDNDIEEIKSGVKKAKPALHRAAESIPDILYTPHALVSTNTIAIGKMIADDLNQLFDSNRDLYPKDKGWQASVVYSPQGDNDDAGSKKQVDLLTPDHPWMLHKRSKTKQVGDRILIVIGMGREGMNNTYCSVVGVAASANSHIEHVQRTLGRSLRSPAYKKDGVWHCPPAQLDTPHIITHESFGNRDVIVKSIEYLRNMRDKVSELTTVEQLLDEVEVDLPEGGVNTVESLSGEEKMGLINAIGVEYQTVGKQGTLFPGSPGGGGGDIDVGAIVDKIHPNASKEKKAAAKRYIDKLINSPSSVVDGFNIRAFIEPINVVTREFLHHEITTEKLANHIRLHMRDLIVDIPSLDSNDPFRRSVAVQYKRYKEAFHATSFRIDLNIVELGQSIGSQLSRLIQPVYCGRDTGLIYAAVTNGIKALFGCSSDEQLKIGSKYDTPNHMAVLSRPEVKDKVVGYAIHQLVKWKCCPNLEIVLNLSEEE